MKQLNRELELIIVNTIGELRDSFVTRFTESICPVAKPHQNKSIFGFFKPHKENFTKKINSEITIAFFCLLKERLLELLNEGKINTIGCQKITEVSCIMVISSIATTDSERKEALLLMQERIESTYVVLSYGDMINFNEKKRIILGCLGDVLLGIDDSIGPRTTLNKRLDEFHAKWKFGADLTILGGMVS